jgi:hypothetical protein
MFQIWAVGFGASIMASTEDSTLNPAPKKDAALPEPKKQRSTGGHEALEVDSSGCSVLNAAQPDALLPVLAETGGVLSSDCDEQLLVSVSFRQPVKLHSVQLSGPGAAAPSELHLFVNRSSMGFDEAESEPATQMLALSPKDVADGGKAMPLAYVKFQNVSTITVFIPANQGGGDTTTLHQLRFFGTPIATTNMQDLKKMG